MNIKVSELMNMERNVLVLRGIMNGRQSTSNVMVFDERERLLFSGKGLERAWEDNKPMISCIPEGLYDMLWEWSPRFKQNLWEIYGVKGRSECKFHAANFAHQINGCIALGDMHIDINGDGANDVRNSRKTLDRFDKAMGPHLGITKAQVKIVNY
jgi:hypothetical protein